jgi:hypothetical protein
MAYFISLKLLLNVGHLILDLFFKYQLTLAFRQEWGNTRAGRVAERRAIK